MKTNQPIKTKLAIAVLALAMLMGYLSPSVFQVASANDDNLPTDVPTEAIFDLDDATDDDPLDVGDTDEVAIDLEDDPQVSDETETTDLSFTPHQPDVRLFPTLFERIFRQYENDETQNTDVQSDHVSETDNLILSLTGQGTTTITFEDQSYMFETFQDGRVYLNGELLEEMMPHIDGGFPVGLTVPTGTDITVMLETEATHRILWLNQDKPNTTFFLKAHTHVYFQKLL